MMTIAPLTRRAGTKIVSILVLFQGTHAPTQPHVPSVIINPFAHAHLVMKKMLMVNVLQVMISNQNSTITYYDFIFRDLVTHIILFFYSTVKKGECDHDTECPDDKACIEHSCRDPCKLSDLCGQGAICETSAHRPVCRCPEGWGGVPTTQCFQCK